MPQSRSKENSAYARKRAQQRKLALIIGGGLLALVLVGFLGRFIYERSKDPDFHIRDWFTKNAELPSIGPKPITDPIYSSEEGSSSESIEGGETVSSSAAETSSEEDQPTAESTEATAESSGQESSAEESSTEPTAEPTTEESTEEPTTAEPSTEAGPTDPTTLAYHLYRSHMTEAELVGTQLITVESNGDSCMLYFFEKTGDTWALASAVPSTPGFVGRNGVASPEKKVEGDGCTPAGYYALGPCYGAEATALTAMEYHQILNGYYWIDDPDSRYYNTLWTADTGLKDWNHAEDMYYLAHPNDKLKYGVYEYAVYVNYNVDPIVPGKGCAIFLHVQDSPTSGCVATKTATMFAVFSWLKPGADPHILIY